MAILFFYLFSKEKDEWFKMFHFVGALTIIALMIQLTVFQTSVDNNYSYEVEKTIIADLKLNNLVLSGNTILNNNEQYHLLTFDNFNDKHLNKYTVTKFCLSYNETGNGANVIRVSNPTSTISEYVYLENDTNGIVCTQINTTSVFNGASLGVSCEDCNSTNTLSLPTYTTTQQQKIVVNNTNPLLYSVSTSDPHAFYIEGYMPPVGIVNDNFGWFMYFLGVYMMFYLMRFLVKYIKEGVDY